MNQQLHATLAHPALGIPAQLQPVLAAFGEARRPRSVTGWLTGPGGRLLAALAETAHSRQLTHALLDEQPQTAALHHVRDMLVQADVLPARGTSTLSGSSPGRPAAPRSPHGHPTCPAVLASLLGVHIQTAVNWASRTRRDWTTYLAERVRQAPQHQGRSLVPNECSVPRTTRPWSTGPPSSS